MTKNVIAVCCLFCFNSFSQSTDIIKVIDCETQEPVPYVSVISAKGKSIGFTNPDGVLQVYGKLRTDSILLRRIGYDSKTVPAGSVAHACLSPNRITLPEAEIFDSSSNGVELLNMFLDKTKAQLLDTKTSLLFDFSLKLYFPSPGSGLTITGRLNLPVNPYSKRYPGYHSAEICQLSCTADSSLYANTVLSDYNFNEIASRLSNDFMRSYSPLMKLKKRKHKAHKINLDEGFIFVTKAKSFATYNFEAEYEAYFSPDSLIRSASHVCNARIDPDMLKTPIISIVSKMEYTESTPIRIKAIEFSTVSKIDDNQEVNVIFVMRATNEKCDDSGAWINTPFFLKSLPDHPDIDFRLR